MKLSIVIPFYNERDSIKAVLEAFAAFAGKYDFELICVDDASADDTAELFSKLLRTGKYPFAKYIGIKPEEHLGYGHAIMMGVKAAAHDVIAWTHSDLQTDPADVFRALDLFIKFQDENVVVKGNRIKRSFKDAAFSFGMACVASVALGQMLFEINAQPKLFHRKFLKYMDKAPNDFSLDLYLLSQAKRHGFRVVTIDVLFHKRAYGRSSWAYSFSSKLKTISRTVKYIFRLRGSL